VPIAPWICRSIKRAQIVALKIGAGSPIAGACARIAVINPSSTSVESLPEHRSGESITVLKIIGPVKQFPARVEYLI
jgi:hypothetical protein